MGKTLALIVEDEEDLAFIFAEAVGEAGFETEIIKTGDETVMRLAESVPALVILDLHLPRVAGTDIMRQIRNDERLANTKVIVVTADASLAESLHEQADLVLVKPIGYRQLRDLANRLRISSPSSR